MRMILAALVLSVLAGCERSDPDRVRACGSDDEESNDVPGHAWDFGSFSDEPRSSRERTATIHTANDVDWYRATVYRRALGSEPLVTVVAPAGFAVTAYHACADCVWGRPITDENGSGCESTEGPESVVRLATRCAGEQSDLLFRVSAQTNGECRKYELRLEVE